ncbi:head fiber protein [Bifidobacterium scardovii]|jgi:hypothetical protein|uniref:head fiber protein n=1 Tax=Bifidobacterium scardovii TaxID=158787 RepID=UPI000B07F5F4|nr:head fiber protein [Bifidobacterium scardovii]MDU3737546.1 head fiber protein [Bifidobacterium scardovii]MDU5610274.1 head fiber protein [Bifidobacterium scardovii]
MAGNYEDMPYVGEAGRKVMEAETADELKSAVSGGSEPQRVSVDSLDGAGTTGKAVMKANDAAAARAAIGAGTGNSNFSGSYNDLSDKPTIPAAYTLPAATANALGGVKQVTLAEDASAADIVTALKAAGIAK